MLEVRNISVDLGEFALRDVTLTVEPGQYMCLAGPTGAGKTVLLECIAGLHRPKTGRILLNDCDVTHLPPESRGIGYVPQDYALFPHMDVLGNITYGLVERAMPGGSAGSRAESAAAILQISHLLHRDVTTLSGGERQRVALARTFVLDCQLLLLDEPLSASIARPARSSPSTLQRSIGSSTWPFSMSLTTSPRPSASPRISPSAPTAGCCTPVPSETSSQGQTAARWPASSG